MNSILMETASTSGTGSTLSNPIILIFWVVILFVVMYFLMIRPQKKEQQKKELMMKDMSVGDTVLTTSGFYGTLIDIDEDTIIVEFGNNKNCRIPMQREAIAAIEKPEDSVKEQPEEPKKKDKKEKAAK